ncbi:hypothetical protein D9M69_666660 [compost metagenome]
MVERELAAARVARGVGGEQVELQHGGVPGKAALYEGGRLPLSNLNWRDLVAT